MKKFILLFTALAALQINAQDVIVKKDGSTILSKVLEVNVEDVKYKRHSNPDGPTYTILKAEIMSINYENGEKDTFEIPQSTNNSQSSSSAPTDEPRLVKRKVAENNAELIKNYKHQIEQVSEPYDQDAKYVTVYMDVSSTSVLSNEDISISLSRCDNQCKEGHYHENEYNIMVENKTDHIIYIDKGNCFRVINKEPYCYYNGTEQTTVGSSGGGGAAIGLGSVAGVLGVGGAIGQLASGVSVGGGVSTSSSTTYSMQRILAIPPHSQMALCENKEIKIKGGWKTIDPHETFIKTDHDMKTPASQFGLYKGNIKLGQLISFDENNSPYQRAYTITYSNSENFNTYSIINFTLYLSYAIGTKLWSGKGEKNLRYIKSGKIYCWDANLEKRK